MPMLLEETLTLDEIMDAERDKRYELIDGRLVEKNEMGAQSDDVAGVLYAYLAFFIVQNKLGRALFDSQYACFPGQIRRPDFSFISNSRLPKKDLPEGRLNIPPDLAVETLSPNDLAYDVDQKVADYIHAGVKEIWVLKPKVKIIFIKKLDGTTRDLDENGILKSDLLPGFSLQVSEIFQ